MAYKSQPTITRPANTTPYTAGDVIGTATSAIITFSGMASQGQLLLTSADLRIHVGAIPAGMTSFRLHLYDDAPTSALADNAQWDLPPGDRVSYLGYVDVGSPGDVGSTLFCQVDGIGKQVRFGAGKAVLYGYLVTNGAYTPASNSEDYVLTLHAVAL